MTTPNEMTERELLDDDGENRALRTFLMQYSCDRATTVGAMLAHMNRSGWRGLAPAFALGVRPEENLTKAGAQLWIRHLLSIEARATLPQPSAEPVGSIAVPRATLTMIYDAMNHICDKLKAMDAVEEDDEKASPAFEAIRALIDTQCASALYEWVPIEPTEAMMHAAEDVPFPRPYGAVYRAMISAANGATQPAAEHAKPELLDTIERERVAGFDTPRFREILRRVCGSFGMLDVFEIEVSELVTYIGYRARQQAGPLPIPWEQRLLLCPVTADIDALKNAEIDELRAIVRAQASNARGLTGKDDQ